ncbi:3'-5' exonuclease-like [Populus alba]|uniref:exoribonuclease II n=1 Tax=Populus alba TaxID=43335 RepID=A0A4U5P514_POPAL|nr:uncharacterized protein D5086_0000229660 [Populus alba]
MDTFLIPMTDGNDLSTTLVTGKDDIDLSFNLLFGDAAGDKVVGFDTEYSLEPKFSRDLDAHVVDKRIALVKLCTKHRCILFRLDRDNVDYVHLLKKLSALLANKDIVFVGVRKRDDLVKLRNEYGLEISNLVELSELVVGVLGEPALGTYGARDLASYLDVLRHLQPRNSILSLINWLDNSLNRQQVMCAVTDTYAAYKIGKKLLEDRPRKYIY